MVLKKQSCKSVNSAVYKPTSTGTLRNVDDATLRNLVYNYGPVIVGMDGAFFNFQSYKSGVLNPRCSAPNHAVNVVGYATTGPGAPYWICKTKAKSFSFSIHIHLPVTLFLRFQSEKFMELVLGRSE